MALTAAEFIKRYDDGTLRRVGINLCLCGAKLNWPDDVHQTKNGLICSDCFSSALGDSVEQHPIVSLRRR